MTQPRFTHAAWHARHRGEMKHVIDARDDALGGVSIGRIGFDELQPIGTVAPLKTLQVRGKPRRQVINSTHPRASIKQSADQMGTDEAGTTSDKTVGTVQRREIHDRQGVGKKKRTIAALSASAASPFARKNREHHLQIIARRVSG